MDDLISRQAAIDALDKRFDSIPMEQTSEILLLRKDLRELPPATDNNVGTELGTNLAEVGTDVPDINVGDINKFIDSLEEIFADIREGRVDDSVCGLCEYDGAYIGESGDWCNECPGFDRDDCFKLSDKCRKRWIDTITKALPSAQPERKTGHWIKTARWGRVYYCDQCRNYLDFDGVNAGRGSTNFCPNCGADMREETE